jgi:transketolase
VTIEDHYPAGGLGEAVLHALADRPIPVTVLAVNETPMSGSGDELRDFAGISASAIVRAVERVIAAMGNDTVVAGRHEMGRTEE